MKKIYLALIIMFLPMMAQADVVNNTGTTKADSMALPFYLLDSTGNVTVLAAGDSLFLHVYFPSGALAFQDTIAHGNALITTLTVAANVSSNTWKIAVADIDGAGGSGFYTYFVFAKDVTGAALVTPYVDHFQLYETRDYNAALDFLDAAITSRLAPTVAARTLDVATTGEAGVDFNNVLGTLDAAEFGADFITAAKIAANSITAVQIDGTFREEIWNTPFSDAATAVGSMWDSLNNSSYVQGSSGLDSSSLAGWIWNTPQSNHTIAGTFGKYLDAEISSIGSGSGAFSYQLVTYDSTTSQVIPGTNLTVRNINQSALIATGKSDLLGFETFNLDADSFIVVATSPGYIYQTFDTLIVTGAGIDTVFGDQFDPGSPSAPALCRVYGYLYSVSAVPEKDAKVSAYLPGGAAQSGNLIISPFMVTTTSDSSGYFYLDLIRSDSLVPAATQYDLIIERSDGTIVHKRITVPDSTSWRLDW